MREKPTIRHLRVTWENARLDCLGGQRADVELEIEFELIPEDPADRFGPGTPAHANPLGVRTLEIEANTEAGRTRWTQEHYRQAAEQYEREHDLEAKITGRPAGRKGGAA